MAEEPSLDELIEQLRRIRIQEAQLVDQIVQVGAREARARHDHRTRVAGVYLGGQVYQAGDRVRITNKVKAGQRPTGTVTRVAPGRISLTTDDGTNTWRAPKNLTRWH
jgi:hypothetical protein